MISDSKRRADRKYRESHYDKICIQLPSGTRDRWKSAASDRGLSLARLIAVSVEYYLSGGVDIETEKCDD